MIEPSRTPHYEDAAGSKHAGRTIDFLLTAKRDKKAAMHLFEKAMQAKGLRHVRRSELAYSNLMRQNPRYRPSRSSERMQNHNL